MGPQGWSGEQRLTQGWNGKASSCKMHAEAIPQHLQRLQQARPPRLEIRQATPSRRSTHAAL